MTDAGEEVAALIERVIELQPPGTLPGDAAERTDLRWFVVQTGPKRPADEQAAWAGLAGHLGW